MTVQTTRMTVVGHRDGDEVTPPARPGPPDARSITIPAASTRSVVRRRRWRQAPQVVLALITLALTTFLVAGGGAVLGRIADDTGVRMARSSSMADLTMLSRAEIREALAHRYYRPLGLAEIEAATDGPRFAGLSALGDPGTRYLSRTDLIARSQARSAWPEPTATLAVVGGVRVGIVTPHVLAGDAGAQVRDRAADLGRRGARVLVVDLRGASGGAAAGGVPDLTATVEAASAVLPPRTAVAERNSDDPADPEVEQTGLAPTLPGVAMAVLVDHATAGPAEVLAAALRDTRHAALVGTPTAGDAMAREEMPLSDGGALVLATAEYRAPSGAVLDRRGLGPDVTVPATSTPAAALSAAVAAAR